MVHAGGLYRFGPIHWNIDALSLQLIETLIKNTKVQPDIVAVTWKHVGNLRTLKIRICYFFSVSFVKTIHFMYVMINIIN